MKNLIKEKKNVFIFLALFVAASSLLGIVRPVSVQVFSAVSQANRKLPVYCVDTPENKVAISFDAAWGADDTDNLLQILADENVKTTFFMCGYWVDKYPDEVKKIAEAGHDLGNHSATHPHMNSLSAEQIKKELADTHKKVFDLTGVSMNLFRPPFGEYNNTVIEAAEQSGYYPIQWDVETNASGKNIYFL